MQLCQQVEICMWDSYEMDNVKVGLMDNVSCCFAFAKRNGNSPETLTKNSLSL